MGDSTWVSRMDLDPGGSGRFLPFRTSVQSLVPTFHADELVPGMVKNPGGNLAISNETLLRLFMAILILPFFSK